MANESPLARPQPTGLDDRNVRLRLVAEELGLASWDVDLTTGDAIWSASQFRMLGYPVNPDGHASYEMWYSCVHPDDRERVLASIARARQDHTVYRCEHRVIRVDNGEVVWLEPHGRFLYDKTGQAARLVGVYLDNTARKQAEERLAHRETQLDLASRIVGIGIFDHDHLRDHLYWSDQLREIHELPEGIEADTAHIENQVVPEDRAALMAAIDAAHDPAGPGTFNVEYRITRRNGEVRWIVGQAQTFFAGDGASRHPVRTVGAELDVTEHKRIEMDLLAERRSLQLALEASGAGAFDWHILAGVTTWSDNHYAIMGLEPGSVPANLDLFRRYVHPDDLERADNSMQEALASDQRFSVEFRIRRANDGEVRWVEAQSLAFRENGRAVRMVGVLTDITERRLAEARLRESEARFRTMADGSPVMIWATNAKNEVEFINTAYCEFFGVTLEQIQRDGWQPLLHPEDTPQFVRIYSDAVRNKTAYRAQARARSASGEWRWLEPHGVPRIGPDGEFQGHLGVSPDITALIQAQAALREADQRKDEFLATLAHELRNPLAPIRTAAQMLTSPNLGSGQLLWARQVIHRQVEHMARLLDDLLDVARITQGKLQLKKEQVNLGTIIETAVEAARPLLDARQHTLTLELPTQLPQLDADPVRLAQVLSNLLTNAAKYTDPPGRIALIVRIEAGVVRISIKDNGIGLSSSALAHIFEMFSQVPDEHGRAEGGLGIGLALVKGLVDLHGGTIEAFSDGPGKGSEFVVKVPFDTGSTSLDSDAAAAGGAVGSPTGRKVLVADDNQDAADTLAMLLSCQGHDVRTAHGGQAALALASTFHPEFALLDIGMPDLNGYEVARQLRQAPWGENLQLVAVTGWGQDEDRRRALTAGFDFHMTKPVDLVRLEEVLSRKAPPRRASRHPG